ncbi:MAG: PEP-CTERM sorting domain-containing protein [Desulfobacteraceae bacterium]|nr:PEP-CTERM sorting domain-containing protein [Desulfobacteraceae bacterium]
MKKSLTLCLLLVFMVVATNGLCANIDSPIVKNGDFETLGIGNVLGDNQWKVYKNIPAWETLSGPGIEIQRGTVADAKSGKNYVELDSNSNSSMSQTLFLAPGDYQLAFWYMPRVTINEYKNNNDNANGINFSIDNHEYDHDNDIESFNKESYINRFYVDGMEWEKVTLDFAVSEESGTDFDLTFGAYGKVNSKGGFVDNVSVTAVAPTPTPTPIPSSLLLLFSGGAGCLVLRKKKVMN